VDLTIDGIFFPRSLPGADFTDNISNPTNAVLFQSPFLAARRDPGTRIGVQRHQCNSKGNTDHEQVLWKLAHPSFPVKRGICQQIGTTLH
jgi:hypothetical protein